MVDKSFQEREKLRGLLQKLTINTMAKDLTSELQVSKGEKENQDDDQSEVHKEEREENIDNINETRRRTLSTGGQQKQEIRKTRKRNATAIVKSNPRRSIKLPVKEKGQGDLDISRSDDVALQTQEARIEKASEMLPRRKLSNYLSLQGLIKNSLYDSAENSVILDNSSTALIKEVAKEMKAKPRRDLEINEINFPNNFNSCAKSEFYAQPPKELHSSERGSIETESISEKKFKSSNFVERDMVRGEPVLEKQKTVCVSTEQDDSGGENEFASVNSLDVKKSLSNNNCMVDLDWKKQGLKYQISLTRADAIGRRGAVLNDDNSIRQISLLAQAKQRRRSLHDEIKTRRRGGIILREGLDLGSKDDGKSNRFRAISQHPYGVFSNQIPQKPTKFNNNCSEKLNLEAASIADEGKHYQKKFVNFEVAFSEILMKTGHSSEKEKGDPLAPVISKFRKVGYLNFSLESTEKSRSYSQQKRDLFLKSKFLMDKKS